MQEHSEKTEAGTDLPASERLAENWVTAEEYCDLLISRKKIERCDAGHPQLSKLCNRQTGEKYVVETSKLGIFR